MTNPVTYQVRDLNNEKILGSFYTRELSLAKQNIFRIEKVIKRTRKSITYNYMLYKGVVVSKINNHYSIIYLGLTN